MLDIVGLKFGRLEIIEDLGMVLQKSGKKRRFVRCKCDCGNTKDINYYDIKSGKITSCGCFHNEVLSKLAKERQKIRRGNPKHNLCHSELYAIFHRYKSHCYNKNNERYKYCGGTGIKFCDEWMDKKNGFLNFYEWANTKGGYSEDKKSLCRKDKEKDFSPENCFFETLNYAKNNCLSELGRKEMKLKNTAWKQENPEKVLEFITKGLKTKLKKYGTIAVNNRESCSWKAGWREIGGKRKYFRSKWEANYARYLEFLKQHNEIKEWRHESKTFWFEKIKRGCRSYLPDFEVTLNNDKIEWHEVKGWYDARSKTVLKRMAKYYPNEKVVVIFGKQYNSIASQMKNLIKDWE